MATISTREPIVGYPFSNVFSIADGTNTTDSTGIPYMYLTDLEMSMIDLQADKRYFYSQNL